jgi:hypothetical protein
MLTSNLPRCWEGLWEVAMGVVVTVVVAAVVVVVVVVGMWWVHVWLGCGFVVPSGSGVLMLRDFTNGLR